MSLNFRVADNKSIEIDWGHFAECAKIFEASFKITEREDHAGARLCFEIIGYFFHIVLYDHRHWDFENDCWEGE